MADGVLADVLRLAAPARLCLFHRVENCTMVLVCVCELGKLSSSIVD